jgi:hypothetical protein
MIILHGLLFESAAMITMIAPGNNPDKPLIGVRHQISKLVYGAIAARLYKFGIPIKRA